MLSCNRTNPAFAEGQHRGIAAAMPPAVESLQHYVMPADTNNIPKMMFIGSRAKGLAQAALSRPTFPRSVEALLGCILDDLADKEVAKLVAIALATTQRAAAGFAKPCSCAPSVAYRLDVGSHCECRQVLA